MASTGGSDGDGGGSRYEKELAGNKLANERFKHGQSGSSGGQPVSGGFGCLGSLIGWLVDKSVRLYLLLLVIGILFKFGSIIFDNAINIGTINQYSMSQYFRNIYHLDHSTKFKVNAKVLNCYMDPNEALAGAKKPFAKLRKGKEFIYRGYKIVDTKTLVAVELIRDEPVYCYAMLPEKWKGLSFWDNDPSEHIVEVEDLEK